MDVIDLLKRHEGFKPTIYHCTANKRTIGYSYNIDANPLELSVFEIEHFKLKGIAEKTAENLLIDQVYKIKFALENKIPCFKKLRIERQAVLINMAYNLGVNGLLGFKKTLQRVADGDYNQASIEMLCSTWAQQVHARAAELSEIMRTGRYQ